MVIKIGGRATAPSTVKGFSARKMETLKKQVEKTAPVKAEAGLPNKVSITIRLSPEVVVFFKSGGPGWHSRIDLALRGLAGLEDPVEKPEGEE